MNSRNNQVRLCRHIGLDGKVSDGLLFSCVMGTIQLPNAVVLFGDSPEKVIYSEIIPNNGEVVTTRMSCGVGLLTKDEEIEYVKRAMADSIDYQI